MGFYNEQQEPLEIEEEDILSRYGIFLIAKIPRDPRKDFLGLFEEDGGDFFLKLRFSRYWLPALIRAAESV